MQMEMEAGGLLFFDLFVAMCNHVVRTPSVTLLRCIAYQADLLTWRLPAIRTTFQVSPNHHVHPASLHIPPLWLAQQMHGVNLSSHLSL